MGRASKAQRDDQFHAIYAVSFKPTPIHFPFVWDPRIKYVSAVNVTDRYTQYGKKVQLPKGHVHVMFRVLEHAGGDRQAAKLRIIDGDGSQKFAGDSRDERFDSNDYLTAVLEQGKKYKVEIRWKDEVLTKNIQIKKLGELITFHLASKKTAKSDVAQPKVD